jgi:ABC-2 type transport system ATP-binding protein
VPDNTVAIQTFKLTKKFNGLTAVDEIDLTIKKGELLSLLGPNGAGKTTTINMLCCLLKPTSGTASILGFDLGKDPFAIKRLIGIAPQDTAVSERLNSWENLSLVGRIHGLKWKELQERSRSLLETVGLLERANDQVRKFSSGMRRRLNLIMALVHDPEVIILDEPSLGLDPQSRRAIWEYIEGLKGKKTILLTTHYMEEAESLSNRIAIMNEGKIVAQGTAEELRNSVSDRQTMIVSAANVTDKVIEYLQGRYPRVEYANQRLEISAEELKFEVIVGYLHDSGVVVDSATLKQPTLEDVFLHITGRALRD